MEISKTTHAQATRRTDPGAERIKEKAQQLTHLVGPLLGAGHLAKISEETSGGSTIKKTSQAFEETDLSAPSKHKFSAGKLPKGAEPVVDLARRIL